jgi:hypothetical protein
LSIPVSKKKRGANKKFNDILLSVIDDSLMRIGSSMRPVVYHCLEREFIKKEEIPVKTEQFSACLKMIFGEEVRYLIEMSIVEKLYIEIEERLEKKRGHTFTDYINNARKKYLKKKR